MTLTSEIHDRDFLVPSSTQAIDTFYTARSPEGVDGRLPWYELFQETSSFLYNDRVRLAFTVADEFAREFVLIRGLIEFHRPKELSFIYDREFRSIVVAVTQEQLGILHQFFGLIYDLLAKERRFRKALRSVIEVENSYRRVLENAYAELKSLDY